MSGSRIRRPTEDAAVAAASRSARQLPPVQNILADLLTANRAGDRRGVNLCAHLVVRATTVEVGE